MIGEQVFLNGAPVGVGQAAVAIPAAAATSPWGMALATSVVGAATGWIIEEVVQKVRGKRRRR